MGERVRQTERERERERERGGGEAVCERKTVVGCVVGDALLSMYN